MTYDPPVSGGRGPARDPYERRSQADSYDSYFRQAPPARRHARSDEYRGDLAEVRAQPHLRPVPYDRAAPPMQYGQSRDRSGSSGRPDFAMTTAGAFWYVLGCIAFGGMYFAKVPVKKALDEAGLATMTSAERFWYVLQCIAFGAGYFAKLPAAKALTEVHGGQPRDRNW